jgi:hypothetical protein
LCGGPAGPGEDGEELTGCRRPPSSGAVPCRAPHTPRLPPPAPSPYHFVLLHRSHTHTRARVSHAHSGGTHQRPCSTSTPSLSLLARSHPPLCWSCGAIAPMAIVRPHSSTRVSGCAPGNIAPISRVWLWSEYTLRSEYSSSATGVGSRRPGFPPFTIPCGRLCDVKSGKNGADGVICPRRVLQLQ